MENKIKIPDRKERRETDLYLLEEELKALKHESVSEYILAHDLSSRGRAAESEIRANLRKRPKGGGFLRSLAIASVRNRLSFCSGVGCNFTFAVSFIQVV